ncbi:hypothetical protein OR1_03010 [Geobacter sp. OR-1]|uniref:glycosyltransferase n=1 Tax=Geobacter sp. OR-1 TaxID=1266765 RepID=UPI000543EE17|nr:glycosyltransferase [Geobacter sp. OR-1]GAM10717.1 hypothetical protein OR1_03010 [Geobacter sp. OR-1]
MILVLVGTNPYCFERLVRAVDLYAEQSGEDLFVQLGHTAYIPRYASHRRFLEKSAVHEKILQSELVITQGGFGSIADCLRAGKKVVAVPRKPELNEAPDCQEELVRELERLGLVTGVYDIADLPRAINEARTRDIAIKHCNRIAEIISGFIEDNI